MKDKEITLPIHSLDKAPWNPKIDIHGVYKNGVKASIEYFDICDRLKVWPNPKSKGRYFILNGNQRIDIIVELRILQKIREHFGINADDEHSEDPKVAAEYRSRLRSIKSDPQNESLLQKFHLEAMQSKVDVTVMERLDEEDAKLFTATYDRNHAKVDEAKLVNNVFDAVTTKNKLMMERMLRPEKAYIQPLPRPATPYSPQVAPNATEPIQAPTETPAHAPAASPVEDYGKWGPPPPLDVAPTPPRPSLIPFTVSLTAAGYKEIDEKILRSKSRVFREEKIKKALARLEDACEDPDLYSIICEVALLTIDAHVSVAEKS